ncbi:hypothetical protein [Paenibacillus sp. 32352]|uniref:hypothetical protein n=1 Tax=Paenibacillus sp. 32352 TaxID=1969111 RepID=UPI0009AF1647|nr:hypothetical protein [Paenibacillus sp. 32352]
MNRKDRKEIVKALGKHFDVKPKYLGAPSFTYEFETPNGIYVVDQTGKVSDPEGKEIELKALLSGSPIEGVTDPSVPSNPVDTADSGAPADTSESEVPNESVASGNSAAPAEPDHPITQDSSVNTDASPDPAPPDDAVHTKPNATDESAAPAIPAEPAAPKPSAEPAAPSDQSVLPFTDLEVTVDMDDHTGATLRNLANLIYSRQALIAKALGYSGNIIEEPFIAAIHELISYTNEKVKEKIVEVAYLCPGITYDFDNNKLTFKFFTGELDADKVQAYTHFVALLNQTAKTLKYASSISKVTDNEKFTFRLFLIRLGMVGEEYKLARKILLSRLEGNSAFRNGVKPEKAVAESVESVG